MGIEHLLFGLTQHNSTTQSSSTLLSPTELVKVAFVGSGDTLVGTEVHVVCEELVAIIVSDARIHIDLEGIGDWVLSLEVAVAGKKLVKQSV